MATALAVAIHRERSLSGTACGQALGEGQGRDRLVAREQADGVRRDDPGASPVGRSVLAIAGPSR